MTYNEPHKVKHLRPRADRQRDAEIAVRRKLVGAKKRFQADDEDEYEEDYGDEEEYEEYTGPIATVTRRYDMPVVVPRRSRVDHYHDDPYFTHAPAAPVQQAAPRKQLKIHWLVYVGICLVLIVVCHYLFNDLATWWQDHQDYSNYGMPRTYQVDAVVGHNDSNSNPSHFIAENLRGHIVVTEYPGGDISKAKVYGITTEMNGNATVPVTVSFQDTSGDGKLDMVVVVGDPGSTTTFTLFNDGTQFVAKL